MKRRKFLERTGTGSLGLVGTHALVGATAAADPPMFDTRDNFDCEANLINGHSETCYHGDDWGVFDLDEVALFVHGFDNSEEDAIQKTTDAQYYLEDQGGYWGTVVGYSWDSDCGWGYANQIARKNGPKLGTLLYDLKSNGVSTVRVITHSLGVEVALSALRYLDGWFAWEDNYYEVDSVQFLGAAIDNEAPTDDRQANYDGIYQETDSTYNYHSYNDGTLKWGYTSASWDEALGRSGAEGGSVPPNYTDRDESDHVDCHSCYLEELYGLMIADM